MASSSPVAKIDLENKTVISINSASAVLAGIFLDSGRILPSRKFHSVGEIKLDGSDASVFYVKGFFDRFCLS